VFHLIIIGEKINGSIPSVAKAIAERDSEFIKERARKQASIVVHPFRKPKK